MSAVTRVSRTASLVATLPLVVFVSGCASGSATPVTPNVPPVAQFVFNPVSPIFAGQTQVLFNARGSSDADGNIVNYVWDFGDGTPQETTPNTAVTHVFPKISRCVDITYAVLLTVTDNKGATNTISNTATVTNLPPPASLQCPR